MLAVQYDWYKRTLYRSPRCNSKNCGCFVLDPSDDADALPMMLVETVGGTMYVATHARPPSS